MAVRPILAALCVVGILCGPTAAEEGRRVVCLDGDWQIAQGPTDQVPASFGHHVPVPGLVDMARPAFADVGQKPDGPASRHLVSPHFQIPARCRPSRRSKSTRRLSAPGCFSTANSSAIISPVSRRGCSTSAGDQGDGQSNELVIRVGAWRDAVGKGLPDGFDSKKSATFPAFTTPWN